MQITMANQACTQLTTALSCGHTFTKIKHHCSPSAQPSCKPTVLRQYIHDTCADCDPGIQRRRLQQEYEQQHRKLVDAYMRARKRGDTDLMVQLQQVDVSCLQKMRLEMYQISLTRADPDVVLPGLVP